MAQKTTIYLTEELKAAVQREARRRGASEAQVIRDAIAASVVRPRPTVGLFEAGPIAEHVDELLAGFDDP